MDSDERGPVSWPVLVTGTLAVVLGIAVLTFAAMVYWVITWKRTTWRKNADTTTNAR